MAGTKNFRNAFNGFNKEDVVSYLEYMNTKHQNQLAQLNAEMEELRSAQGEDQSELVASLQEENAALTQALEEAQAKIQMLESQEGAEPATDVTPELETYRRAERIEREAKERAELVYFQANNVIKEANARIEEAMGEMTDNADQVVSQLTQLQVAISNSKIALQDAVAVLNTIRPNR